MTTIVLLFVVGLLLSAFFSGTETGFYRANRARLVMDAMAGGWGAKGLLWLCNRPAAFVATTLVGNNVANYVISLALVMLAHRASAASNWSGVLLPLISSPLVFVLGELLPKSIFYHVPNRLLRNSGPLILAFTVLFAPISAMLWLLGRVSQSLFGQPPLRVYSTLARQELQEMIQEGQAAGLLQPHQRQLAEKLMEIASQSVRPFCRSTARMAQARLGQSKDDLLTLAKRLGQATILVTYGPRNHLAGYVRVIDLQLSDSATLHSCLPLHRVPHTENHLGALIRMQTQNLELVEVIDERGRTVGVVFLNDLLDPLFRA